MEGLKMQKLLKAIRTALAKRNEPQIGTIDFETGKVIW
jgi:hypothetical protein